MSRSNDAVTIAKHISSFLNEYAPTYKTGSANTLKSYHDALSLYLQFLEQGGITFRTLSVACFEKRRIEDWLKWLYTERGNQPETCNNRLAQLRVFLKYLGHKDICLLHLYDEAKDIERFKTGQKKVNGLTRPAVQAILATPNQSTLSGRRDLVLILLLYSTAARIDEMLSLKVGQLHLDGTKPYATVVGKGQKIRTLYLLPRAVSHLKRYILDYHGNSPDPDAYLFYSRNNGPHGKLTAAAVDKMLKKHAVKAHEKCDEVPINLHAHQFRHAKASHWLEDGMNIVQISYLLGHAQIQTTMVYLDITTEDEAKALATLENEADKNVSRKWNGKTGSLREFCGLSSKR